MNYIYTSRDAYNGCLSLYSKEEAEQRGYINWKIADTTIQKNNMKAIKPTKHSHSKYVQIAFTNITKRGTGRVLPRLNTPKEEDEYEEDMDILPTGIQVSTKIIITTKENVYNPPQPSTISIVIANFNFEDNTIWPPLISKKASICEIMSAYMNASPQMIIRVNMMDTSSVDGDWSICGSEEIPHDDNEDEEEEEDWEILSSVHSPFMKRKTIDNNSTTIIANDEKMTYAEMVRHNPIVTRPVDIKNLQKIVFVPLNMSSINSWT
jgi:hypothetical protein